MWPIIEKENRHIVDKSIPSCKKVPLRFSININPSDLYYLPQDTSQLWTKYKLDPRNAAGFLFKAVFFVSSHVTSRGVDVNKRTVTTFAIGEKIWPL